MWEPEVRVGIKLKTDLLCKEMIHMEAAEIQISEVYSKNPSRSHFSHVHWFLFQITSSLNNFIVWLSQKHEMCVRSQKTAEDLPGQSEIFFKRWRGPPDGAEEVT